MYHVDDFMYGFLILSSFRELMFLRVFPLLECLDITDDGVKNGILPKKKNSGPDLSRHWSFFLLLSVCYHDSVDLIIVTFLGLGKLLKDKAVYWLRIVTYWQPISCGKR